MSRYEDEQQATLERQWEASTDPEFREAYALAKRAGFRWYNTESAARRMAEHAAEELLKQRRALAAVLLFHSSEAWTGEKQQAWRALTGAPEATTRALCDFVRSVMPT
jgi:hypothetical protein